MPKIIYVSIYMNLSGSSRIQDAKEGLKQLLYSTLK